MPAVKDLKPAHIAFPFKKMNLLICPNILFPKLCDSFMKAAVWYNRHLLYFPCTRIQTSSRKILYPRETMSFISMWAMVAGNQCVCVCESELWHLWCKGEECSSIQPHHYLACGLESPSSIPSMFTCGGTSCGQIKFILNSYWGVCIKWNIQD